jgi:hypothetical protein
MEDTITTIYCLGDEFLKACAATVTTSKSECPPPK